MSKKTRDLIALGAAALPTRDLLTLVGVHADESTAAEHALALVGNARDVALQPLASGPRLVAALELGRRAWMLPSPAGRRVRSPVDVAAICAPRLDTGTGGFVLALDRRLAVARLAKSDLNAVGVLRETLSAGVARVAVAIDRRGHSAVPTHDDELLGARVREACALVEIVLVDIVLLGDDGFCSFTRLGLLPSIEQRYR